jgi:hypothetical protein
MNAKETEILEEKLIPYKLATIQDYMTFMHYCQRQKINMDQLHQYVQQQFYAYEEMSTRSQNQQIAIEKMIAEKFPRCSICKSQLMLEDINNNDARMVDDHSHSWWICPDPDCKFEPETDDRYPQEIMADMGILINKPKMSRAKRRRAANQKRRGQPQRKG